MTDKTAGQVLIADDHPLIRQALASILEPAGYSVSEAVDGEQAVEAASELRPDVVLMDVRMPGMSGIEATRRITAHASAPRVLMLSVDESRDTVRAAMQAGAAGYLAKSAASGSLILDAVRRTAGGETVFIPSALGGFSVEDLGSPLPAGSGLTVREEEIARLAATGASNAAIAAALSLSPRTVENHLSSVFRKLGIAGRVQLAHVQVGQAGPQARAGQMRGVVFADVAAFSTYSASEQLGIREALAGLLRQALEDSGIPWSASTVEDRGDGVVVATPAGFPASHLIDPFSKVLGHGVERHNGLVATRLNMQLRIALDAGPVEADALGLSGETLVRAARLVDSGVFRAEMHACGATLGVIVSEPLWDMATSQGARSLAPAARRVSINAKEAVIPALMWFTGNAVPPALRPSAGNASHVLAKASSAGAARQVPAAMRYRLLGPLEVRSGEEGWTAVSAPKWRSLLASLLVSAGQPVSTEELIRELWGESPPSTADNLISIYVHRLRKVIGDPEGKLLTYRARGYQLGVADGETDAQQFELMIREAREALTFSDTSTAVVRLNSALELWRGPLLADVPPSPRISRAADRLSELRLDAIELKCAADIQCRAYDRAISELRRHLPEHPLREELWLLLMRALHEAGRHAEALNAYDQARNAISDELGVEPGAALARMHADILADQQNP